MPAGIDDTRLDHSHARTDQIRRGVRDMQWAQINKRRYAARARRDHDGGEVLPLDPRDPEIIRGKHLQMAARSRLAPRAESPRT